MLNVGFKSILEKAERRECWGAAAPCYCLFGLKAKWLVFYALNSQRLL